MEEEDGGTEIGLLTLELDIGPAFDAAGTAAVKVAFCIDADVGGVNELDVVREDDCFEGHR